MPGEMNKDIVLQDGNREVRIRIDKMDCISAQDWILRLGCLLVKAGVPIPNSIATSVEEVGEMVLGFVQSGRIFQMPGITYREVKELLGELYKWVHFYVPGENSSTKLIQCNPATIQGQIQSMGTLFRLQMEVLGFSYGFFGEGKSLESELDKFRSSLQTSPTSPPSSEPSSHEARPRFTTSEVSTV